MVSGSHKLTYMNTDLPHENNFKIPGVHQSMAGAHGLKRISYVTRNNITNNVNFKYIMDLRNKVKLQTAVSSGVARPRPTRACALPSAF